MGVESHNALRWLAWLFAGLLVATYGLLVVAARDIAANVSIVFAVMTLVTYRALQLLERDR